MNRREFLKGTAGFVVACGAGFGAIDKLSRTLMDADQVGPRLLEGLSLEGDCAYLGLEKVFEVNELGAKLLAMADGRHDLGELARAGGGDEAAVARFFLTLGQAGYLRDRIEVDMVEVQL